MSEPNLTSCKAKLTLWQSARNMDNTIKNDMVNEVFREKCPCILLNNSNIITATYFGKRVTKEECNRPKNNSKKNTKNISNLANTYEKYIWTTNTDPMYYYIYVRKDDKGILLDIINNYTDKSKFTIQEAEKYISVSSFQKEDLEALILELHKSNTSNLNNTNKIPLYPVTTVQAAGSRKKQTLQKQIKTHRKNKIVSINKKSKTKKRISRFK
jgi:hypothetical protein